MLTVKKKGFFEDRYIFNKGEEEVARLTTGVWPHKGRIELGNDQYWFYRNGYVSGTFILGQEGNPIASAEKPRAFADHFIIQVGKLTFEITREARFNSAMTVWWEDEQIGTITEGTKNVHAIIDLPDSLSPSLQIFFFGLVQILWDRHTILNAIGG